MGVVDFIASSKEGINLNKIKNKGLTDGDTYVNNELSEDKSSSKN